MIDGIINVYKEKGFTSHDVVAKLRGILHQKKIGHTGTLDPDAVGVLPVCLGRATKVCEFLTEETKTYQAVLLLGKTTDTQDISGAVLSEAEVSAEPEEVRQTILGFLGASEQIPPMYSALKVHGKKLYELARAGVTVERKARPIFLFDIQIQNMELPRVAFQVTCSKGTYVRTLCHDIGQRLGCGGCMESLVRTQAAGFSIEDSMTLAQIEERAAAGTLMEKILPVETCFQELSVRKTKKAFDRLLYNGNPILESQLEKAESLEKAELPKQGVFVRMQDSGGRFIGLYKTEDGVRWKPEKMFYGGSE